MSDPFICGACGKVYLYGDEDGLCDDPNCRGAVLDPLLGFISYRRKYLSYKGVEENDLASRIKDRVEKVLHARRIGGGFFIDKTGIEREDFEDKISKTLRACKNKVFILILTPGALDPRGNDNEDWMRKEIALALEHNMEIIPVKVSKYRQDKDFDWPESLSQDIAAIQKKNVTLSYIGDLDERYLVDATHHLVNEIILNLKLETAISPSIGSDVAPNGKFNTQVLLDINQWQKIISKKMVEIPSGKFMMGSNKGTVSEKPIHEVEVSSFYMMKCLVTQRDYEKISGANPSNFVGDPNRPVESVSWFDAIQFCNKWSASDGLDAVYEISDDGVEIHFGRNGYRLPTEAEWEYACRANSQDEFFWGPDDDQSPTFAWFDSNSEDTTHSVGTKQKNGFGLYDMCGNVWEWTSDWFSADYYQHSEKIDPTGPEFGEVKVLRGGCWFNGVSRLRCGSRLKRQPSLVDDVTGFRCVARWDK
jgi:formylglycine-generating enzyme required for sulfatase activity